MISRLFFILGFTVISCIHDKPPEIIIVSPQDGTRVIGKVTIQAIATDDFGVKNVKFAIDDSTIGVDSERPYLACWDADSSGDLTPHTVLAQAYDSKDQSSRDSITLIVDRSLKPPVITFFDTTLVRSTSLWILWKTEGGESVSVYRSLSPGIDTIEDLISTLPAIADSFHDLFLIQDKSYYYLIIAKDKDGQMTRSPTIQVKTARSLTITWLLMNNAVTGWTKDGSPLRASSPEELLSIMGDSAQPYINNGFIDFTLQSYKGKLTNDSPDTNHLNLYLFDMKDSIQAKAVYDSIDPGHTIPYDSVGDEARYYFDSKHAFLDFRRRNGFVRIFIDCGLPQAVAIIKKFAFYVDQRIL